MMSILQIKRDPSILRFCTAPKCFIRILRIAILYSSRLYNLVYHQAGFARKNFPLFDYDIRHHQMSSLSGYEVTDTHPISEILKQRFNFSLLHKIPLNIRIPVEYVCSFDGIVCGISKKI